MKNFFILLLFPILYSAQEKDSISSNIEFTANIQYGQVLKTNFYIKKLDNLDYKAASFMVSKRTNGEKQWQRKFGNPTFGIGVTTFDFMKHEEFGNATALFLNYSTSAKDWKKFNWNYWINFGIAFNSNAYHYPDYPNPSLGSKTNMYIGLGTAINYELSKHFDLGLGFGLHHFSNGATNTPNKGQNFGAPQLSLTYHPEERREQRQEGVGDDVYDRYNTVEVSAFYGKKEAHYKYEDRSTLPDPYSGFFYNVYGIEGLYTKQFTYKSSWGIGLGLVYDEEYNHTMYASE